MKIKIAALAALLILGIAAPAGATHYNAFRHGIKPGETVVAPTTGKLKMRVRAVPKGKEVHGAVLVKTECITAGSEAFFNSATEGFAETRTLTLDCEEAPCGAVTVTPILPWPSTLVIPADLWPLVSEMQATVEVSCGETNYGRYEGTLDPTIGDNDPQGFTERKIVDDADASFNFNFEGGQLEQAGGRTVVFANSKGGSEGGADWKLGDEITGECELPGGEELNELCGPDGV